MGGMAHLGRMVLTLALAAGVFAQTANDGEKVWAVAAFINNGETTPLSSALNTVLTPEGAQQMQRQGTAFRARYLRNGVNSTEYGDVEKAYVQNVNIHAIDNSDFDILSQTFEWVNAGAMAFMQGLYPPEDDSWDSSSGGSDIAHNYVQGDNVTSYPLNGYQYPNIQTLSILDPQSVAIQGSFRCAAWQSEVRGNLTFANSLQSLFNDTLDFYQQLFTTAPLAGAIDLEYANLWNAYLIYDYVNYMYKHNETVNENLQNATGTLAQLESYAFILEHAKNSAQNGNGNDDPLNVLYTIAGRTLASRVAQAFVSNVRWSGDRDRMTLMFGSFEPIMSFLSVSGLINSKTITSGPFATIPEPGAAIVFELYGENPEDANQQPSFDGLSVRFYYRPNADNSSTFQLQPLFYSEDNANVLSYTAFLRTMRDLGRSSIEWCNICGPTPEPWCAGYLSDNDDDDGDRSSNRNRTRVNPAVAGVLGALIMLAIIACVCGALYIFGGVTLKRNHSREMAGAVGRRDSGGFKGPEKKDRDKDVAVTRTGVHHERVGSWELRNAADLPTTVTPIGAGLDDKDAPRERSNSIDEDDAISIAGATPVKAHETV